MDSGYTWLVGWFFKLKNCETEKKKRQVIQSVLYKLTLIKVINLIKIKLCMLKVTTV